MDLLSLNDAEVTKLIKELKFFLNNTKLDVPAFGKYKKDIEVKGQVSHVLYRFHAYQGNLENKYSLHLRFEENNVHLIRLCINGSKHHNSDGTSVGKNHLHIYRSLGQNEVEDYAYDLEDYPFSKVDGLAEAIEKFLTYVNLQEKERGA